jgi:hypothetical protein
LCFVFVCFLSLVCLSSFLVCVCVCLWEEGRSFRSFFFALVGKKFFWDFLIG